MKRNEIRYMVTIKNKDSVWGWDDILCIGYKEAKSVRDNLISKGWEKRELKIIKEI